MWSRPFSSGTTSSGVCSIRSRARPRPTALVATTSTPVWFLSMDTAWGWALNWPSRLESTSRPASLIWLAVGSRATIVTVSPARSNAAARKPPTPPGPRTAIEGIPSEGRTVGCPPMTYSILARDSETGQLGVAVQSHWFSVGAVVPWAAPGVGAVATQANAEISYGPRALELLGSGAGAREALDRLLAEDPAAPSRQVAVMDAQGRAAVHTGSDCIPLAGHVVGDGVCCQANI